MRTELYNVQSRYFRTKFFFYVACGRSQHHPEIKFKFDVVEVIFSGFFFKESLFKLWLGIQYSDPNIQTQPTMTHRSRGLCAHIYLFHFASISSQSITILSFYNENYTKSCAFLIERAQTLFLYYVIWKMASIDRKFRILCQTIVISGRRLSSSNDHSISFDSC